MNVTLLRKIQDKIKKHPEHFEMSNWFCDSNNDYADLSKQDPIQCIRKNEGLEKLINTTSPNCGTKACVAGWAILLSPEYHKAAWDFVQSDKAYDSNSFEFWIESGAKVLDINEYQAKNLFLPQNWPSQFLEVDNFGEIDDQTTPELAVARIDHFIATNGEE